MTHRLVAALVLLAAVLAACDALANTPQQGCAELGVTIQRCEAIVDEARGRLGAHQTIAQIVVIPATQADRTTLRAQHLLATVRFTFTDGTSELVPIFCGPAGLPRLACMDGPVGR
jgi:hypothetical protein